MREELLRREEQHAAELLRRDQELQRLQLSPSNNKNSAVLFSESGRVCGSGDTRSELEYKLKPDTFDGTVPLREFFFNSI